MDEVSARGSGDDGVGIESRRLSLAAARLALDEDDGPVDGIGATPQVRVALLRVHEARTVKAGKRAMLGSGPVSRLGLSNVSLSLVRRGLAVLAAVGVPLAAGRVANRRLRTANHIAGALLSANTAVRRGVLDARAMDSRDRLLRGHADDVRHGRVLTAAGAYANRNQNERDDEFTHV